VTTEQNPAPAVKSANQRGAARLAAVQALYQMDIGGAGVLEIVAEYEAHGLAMRSTANSIAPPMLPGSRPSSPAWWKTSARSIRSFAQA
jgi:transcription termination factor NusB